MNLKTPLDIEINWDKVLIGSAIAFGLSLILALVTHARVVFRLLEAFDVAIVLVLLVLATIALIKAYSKPKPPTS